MSRGTAKGRISIRRAQMKMLESGNGTMGVWLGKQLLGQRDPVDMQHPGKAGGPFTIQFFDDLLRKAEAEAGEK